MRRRRDAGGGAGGCSCRSDRKLVNAAAAAAGRWRARDTCCGAREGKKSEKSPFMQYCIRTEAILS